MAKILVSGSAFDKMSTSFLTILLFFTFIDSILSQFMVGESTRTNCHDLCHSAGYICESEIFGSFSCSVAAQTYCKDPFVREQHTYDPRQLTCYTGGGCFVNCNENSYLELHRINGTCGINNCEIGEFSYRIICPCIPKPTPPPEYEITMTETEEIGTLSLVSLSICGILWLLCCSCSTDVIRRSFYL